MPWAAERRAKYGYACAVARPFLCATLLRQKINQSIQILFF